MPGGIVNRALLSTFYQDAGQVYDDNKTESAYSVLADQTDANWTEYAANKTTTDTKIDGLQAGTGIADGGVITIKLADGSVTSIKLANLSVTTQKLALLAVTAAQIADGTITATQLADNSVTSAKIADGTIATGDITDGAITSAKIADGAITNVDISAVAAIDTAKIGAGTVSNTEFGYLDGVTQPIQAQINGLVVGSIPDGSVTLAKLSFDPATQVELDAHKANAVLDHPNGSVTNAKIAPGIDAAKLADGTVSNAEFQYLGNVTSDIQAQLNTKGTIASGTGSPVGVVTPTATGELYLDRTSGLNYVSNGVTNTSWVVETQFSSVTQQAIINAAMEIWQQGTTFTNPANNAYTADMWLTSFSTSGTLPTSIVHSQVALGSGELFNSKYAYNINFNSAGSGFGVSDSYGVKQKIEFGTSKLCGNGKKVTVSFYAKCGIGGKRLAVGLKQAYGTGGSPSATEILTPTATTIRNLTDVTSQFVLYTFTFITNTLSAKTFGTNNDDYLELAIYEMWGATFATSNLGGGSAETFLGSGSIAFTQVVVNAGDQALPFQPKSFNDELLACMRYFEKSYDYNINPSTTNAFGIESRVVPSNTIAIGQPYGKFMFSVKKRSMPSITVYPFTTPSNTNRVSANSGADLGANSGNPTNIGQGGFMVLNGSGVTLTTTDSSIIFHWVADARL